MRKNATWTSALNFVISLLINWNTDGGRHVSRKCNKKYHLETLSG